MILLIYFYHRGRTAQATIKFFSKFQHELESCFRSAQKYGNREGGGQMYAEIFVLPEMHTNVLFQGTSPETQVLNSYFFLVYSFPHL